MHESPLIDDSSLHTFSHRHFIHTPYFNKHAYFYILVHYLIVYTFLCFSLINTFVLFYFLSKYMQTFQKDTSSFTKNSHVLSHPTHLFTNTYYLHTYLIYFYTLLTLHFPFSISFTAHKRFSITLLYSFNILSYSFVFFIHNTLHLLTFLSFLSSSLTLYRITSSSLLFLSFSFSFLLK